MSGTEVLPGVDGRRLSRTAWCRVGHACEAGYGKLPDPLPPPQDRLVQAAD